MNIVENGYYQHKYGGIYTVHQIARDAETKQDMVVYSHIYPFETSAWVRPIIDWENKFRKITQDEFNTFMYKDRTQFQQEILSRKSNA